MDALRLDQRAAEDLHPLLSDLISSLTLVKGVPADVTGLVETWLITMNQMRAAEEVGEEQGREMLFDMDKAYNGFHRFLKQNKSQQG